MTQPDLFDILKFLLCILSPIFNDPITLNHYAQRFSFCDIYKQDKMSLREGVMHIAILHMYFVGL